MRKLFVVLLVAFTASANETSYRSLQSGSASGGTPLHDRGIRGEGQIIAVLDTGLNLDSCYFAEHDGVKPPFNRFGATAVDLTRRKVIAYDFLWDDPNAPNAFDNQGHGTHAAGAAAGDRGASGVHDFGDAIAPAAKLVIQDAGFIGGDSCSSRPGIGCPVVLTPILQQAYTQGVRIHSNSWGDRSMPTAFYSPAARDVDAFVQSHPDMLVVFNTGNFLGNGFPPAQSLSSPGCAKNTLQVGGTRDIGHDDDELLSGFSLVGPTRDGRIKPDLVGPAVVVAGDIEFDGDPNTCDFSYQAGTSWASPTIAGAAALVRQYYTDGFYPSGVRTPANSLTPSAALLKATLIAAARPARFRFDGVKTVAAQPAPSAEQGWGFPVLDDALYFAGDRARMRVVDVPAASGLAQGESATITVSVNSGTPLKVVLVWTDPPGSQLVNDLDLRVNGVAQADRVNNVEVVTVPAPASGTCVIDVNALRLGSGARQGYALVITGDFTEAAPRRRVARHS